MYLYNVFYNYDHTPWSLFRFHNFLKISYFAHIFNNKGTSVQIKMKEETCRQTTCHVICMEYHKHNYHQFGLPCSSLVWYNLPQGLRGNLSSESKCYFQIMTFVVRDAIKCDNPLMQNTHPPLQFQEQYNFHNAHWQLFIQAINGVSFVLNTENLFKFLLLLRKTKLFSVVC